MESIEMGCYAGPFYWGYQPAEEGKGHIMHKSIGGQVHMTSAMIT